LRFDFERRVLKPRPDAVETLILLKNDGLKLGLISNCMPVTPIIWPETPFAALIDVPVFSCVEGIKKPDSRIYHLACDRLGVKPHDCLYIGDGARQELEGATAVGMKGVLLRTKTANDTRAWRGLGIDSLKEALRL
jgi:putative hydrolase of the HAD superfamily